MKSRHMALVLVLGLASLCGVQAKEPVSCHPFEQPVSSAQVLNAIGDGQFERMVACGLPPNGVVRIDGQAITPLQFAASLGRPDLIEQVVRAGADPNFGGTGDVVLPPLEIALSSRKYDAARVLVAYHANAGYELPDSRTTALMAVAFDDSPEPSTRNIARYLVQHGAQIDAADAKGNTPLHWAARAGNVNYARTLLELRADACVVNKQGQRPAEVVPAQQPVLRSELADACR